MPIIPAEGATCSRCKQWRPQSEFYRRNKVTENRYSWCRMCHSPGMTGSGPAHWGKDGRATEKRCIGCGNVLPIDSFHLMNPKTGQRRERCGPCHNARNRAYKQANREKVRAQSRGYYATNPDAAKARVDRYREQHPEEYRAVHSKWKSANTETVNASTHRRRAKLKGNGGSWTADEWRAIKAQFDHRCLMCSRQEPEVRLTVDHVIPIDLGGSNMIANIQPLCKSCNSKKHRGIIDLRPLAKGEPST